MNRPVKEEAEKIIQDHIEQGERKKKYTLHTYAEGIVKTYERIIWRKNLPAGEISGVPTGITGLDEVLDGWQPGELAIIAGKTGRGKTAFIQQAIRHAGKRGYPIGFVTVEMNEYQLFIRELAVASKILIRELHTGNITDSEEQQIMKAIDRERLHELPITITYDALTVQAVEEAGREMVEEKKCKLIVVDYLQLLKNEIKSGSREQEVASIITMLKGFAKRYKVPVVIISSLNRAGDFETNKDPELSNLRDSGNIEYAADVVLFVVTDWVNKTAKIIFGKGRNYGKQTIYLRWDPYLTQFREIEEEEA